MMILYIKNNSAKWILVFTSKSRRCSRKGAKLSKRNTDRLRKGLSEFEDGVASQITLSLRCQASPTASCRSRTNRSRPSPSSWRILQFFLQNFANFWRARSRLYQNEILQENMRLTAFFKLYKICILLHHCNLKIFAKNRFEKSAIFVKIQETFCKCRKICKLLPNFKKFS